MPARPLLHERAHAQTSIIFMINAPIQWIDLLAPATLRLHARSPDMADKYVGRIVGLGTDNVEYVIYIYQDETVERSSSGMVRHEGLKHFEMQMVVP